MGRLSHVLHLSEEPMGLSLFNGESSELRAQGGQEGGEQGVRKTPEGEASELLTGDGANEGCKACSIASSEEEFVSSRRDC